jgi:signal transduction histidine kinase
VDNRKGCKEVTVLENITKNVKTSTMFNETEHLIQEMFENIVNIRQNRETNSSSVKEQKRIIQNEIHELRIKVNNILDKLQEYLMKELAEAEQISHRINTSATCISRREKEKTARIPEKYSQHIKVRVSPRKIYSRKANRERRRNTRHLFAVISQQR